MLQKFMNYNVLIPADSEAAAATPTMTATQFLIILGVAIVLGILTSLVFTFRYEHSASFGISLALLPMAVTVVIMLVNGNIGTGIAVAGAFALVRFRSVPGTAREISAVFSTMALGLALGMGYVGYAVAFFVLVAVVTIVLTLLNFGSDSKPEKVLRITIPEGYNYNHLFDDLFEQYTKTCHMKRIKTTNMGTLFELTYLVRFKGEEIPKEFIDEIRTRNGNLNVIIDDVMMRESL
ncbi:MAG: DUF4956 domain-containing protein [Eubacterium sp.]|nr:DUF4956 domain-containing protein [Eubacterium sp.]